MSLREPRFLLRTPFCSRAARATSSQSLSDRQTAKCNASCIQGAVCTREDIQHGKISGKGKHQQDLMLNTCIGTRLILMTFSIGLIGTSKKKHPDLFESSFEDQPRPSPVKPGPTQPPGRRGLRPGRRLPGSFELRGTQRPSGRCPGGAPCGAGAGACVAWRWWVGLERFSCLWCLCVIFLMFF